jgi:hypothetical protein
MKLVHRTTGLSFVGLAALAGLFLAGGAGPAAADDDKRIEFDMVRSTTALNAGCLPDAMARVTIESKGPVCRRTRTSISS